MITGGASGIGRAAAVEFATHGAAIAVGDIDEAGIAATVAMVEERGSRGLAVTCDVTKAADLQRLITQAEDQLGGVDIVFGNAGVFKTALFDDLTQDAFEHHIAVNLTANLILTKMALPAFRRRGGGSIVFNASLGGLRGTRGSAAYNASKGGLVNLTRSLADELAAVGVRVNCVCPGWIDTPFNEPFWHHAGPDQLTEVVRQIPLGRQGSPEEIARAVLFLASDESSYITGQQLIVDGGLLAT